MSSWFLGRWGGGGRCSLAFGVFDMWGVYKQRVSKHKSGMVMQAHQQAMSRSGTIDSPMPVVGKTPSSTKLTGNPSSAITQCKLGVICWPFRRVEQYSSVTRDDAEHRS